MPQFDYIGAKAAGASDEQIQSFLKQNGIDFDLAGAKAAGAGDKQINDFLANVDAVEVKKKDATTNIEPTSSTSSASGLESTSVKPSKPEKVSLKSTVGAPLKGGITERITKFDKAFAEEQKKAAQPKATKVSLKSTTQAAPPAFEYPSTQQLIQQAGVPPRESTAVQKVQMVQDIGKKEDVVKQKVQNFKEELKQSEKTGFAPSTKDLTSLNILEQSPYAIQGQGLSPEDFSRMDENTYLELNKTTGDFNKISVTEKDKLPFSGKEMYLGNAWEDDVRKKKLSQKLQAIKLMSSDVPFSEKVNGLSQDNSWVADTKDAAGGKDFMKYVKTEDLLFSPQTELESFYDKTGQLNDPKSMIGKEEGAPLQTKFDREKKSLAITASELGKRRDEQKRKLYNKYGTDVVDGIETGKVQPTQDMIADKDMQTYFLLSQKTNDVVENTRNLIYQPIYKRLVEGEKEAEATQQAVDVLPSGTVGGGMPAFGQFLTSKLADLGLGIGDMLLGGTRLVAGAFDPNKSDINTLDRWSNDFDLLRKKKEEKLPISSNLQRSIYQKYYTIEDNNGKKYKVITDDDNNVVSVKDPNDYDIVSKDKDVVISKFELLKNNNALPKKEGDISASAFGSSTVDGITFMLPLIAGTALTGGSSAITQAAVHSLILSSQMYEGAYNQAVNAGLNTDEAKNFASKVSTYAAAVGYILPVNAAINKGGKVSSYILDKIIKTSPESVLTQDAVSAYINGKIPFSQLMKPFTIQMGKSITEGTVGLTGLELSRTIAEMETNRELGKNMFTEGSPVTKDKLIENILLNVGLSVFGAPQAMQKVSRDLIVKSNQEVFTKPDEFKAEIIKRVQDKSLPINDAAIILSNFNNTASKINALEGNFPKERTGELAILLQTKDALNRKIEEVGNDEILSTKLKENLGLINKQISDILNPVKTEVTNRTIGTAAAKEGAGTLSKTKTDIANKRARGQQLTGEEMDFYIIYKKEIDPLAKSINSNYKIEPEPIVVKRAQEIITEVADKVANNKPLNGDEIIYYNDNKADVDTQAQQINPDYKPAYEKPITPAPATGEATTGQAPQAEAIQTPEAGGAGQPVQSAEAPKTEIQKVEDTKVLKVGDNVMLKTTKGFGKPLEIESIETDANGNVKVKVKGRDLKLDASKLYMEMPVTDMQKQATAAEPKAEKQIYIPFEVNTYVEGTHQENYNNAIKTLVDSGVPEQEAVFRVNQEVANAIEKDLKKILEENNIDTDVISVIPSKGGYTNTESGKYDKSPNIVVSLKPETSEADVRKVMEALNKGADQQSGNAFMEATPEDVANNHPDLHGILMFEKPKEMTESEFDNMMLELHNIKDSNGESFLTGHTDFGDNAIGIGGQFYGKEFNKEFIAKSDEINRILQKYGVNLAKTSLETKKILTYDRGTETNRDAEGIQQQVSEGYRVPSENQRLVQQASDIYTTALKQVAEGTKPTEPTRTYTAENVNTIETTGLDERQTGIVSRLKNIITAISKIVPAATGKELSVNLHFDIREYKKAVLGVGGTEADAYATKGFYLSPKGEIHINMKIGNSETLAHEAFHPVLDYMAIHKPEIIDELHTQLQDLEGGKKASEDAINDNIGASDTTVKKEAITNYVARVADGTIKITRSNFEKIKDFIVNGLKKIGINITTDITNISELRNLAQEISQKFQTGEEIKAKEKGISDVTEPQFQTEKLFLDNKKIQKLLTDAGKFVKGKVWLLEDTARALEKYLSKNKVFNKPMSELTDKEIINGIKKETEKELAAWQQELGSNYISFYKTDIIDRLNPKLQEFAQKRYGRALTPEEISLYHMVSGFASPQATPEFDSSKGLDVFDRYMMTKLETGKGVLSGLSDKQATIWTANEKGKKVDTGVPKFDAEGNPIMAKISMSYAQESLLKFNKILEYFDGDLKKTMDWIFSIHPYEEVSKVMGTPLKGEKSLDEHENFSKKDGGFGIFGFTGAKLGSYVLNRVGEYSTVTKDMWYARTMARFTGIPLISSGKVLKEPWSPTTKGTMRFRSLADKAWEDIAKKQGLDPSDIQERMWDYEKRLWEKLGSVESASYSSKGFLKRANELEPDLRLSNDEPQFQRISWEVSEEGKGDPTISVRNPMVQKAAQDLKDGKISNEEYRAIASQNSPIRPITRFFEPATEEQIYSALDANKKEKTNVPIEDGTKVGLRLDIPAYNNKNTWVITVHDGTVKNGKPISYTNVARIKNAYSFESSPLAGLNIAGGVQKTSIGKIFGTWENIEGNTLEEKGENAKKLVQEIINDSRWVQVGMNPFRHSYFYDRSSDIGKPIRSADEVVQIGGLVYAKNPVYGKWTDEAYRVKDLLDANQNPVQFQRIPAKINGQEVEVRRLPEGVDVINGFYSPIEKRIAETKIDKQSATKWLNIVGSGDEAIFSGVKNWLESFFKPNENVSKSDIQRFMKNNRIEIVEIAKGEWERNLRRRDIFIEQTGIEEDAREMLAKNKNITSKNYDKAYQDYLNSNDRYNELIKEAKELDKEALRIGSTRHSAYQLDGEKRNYREILITAPSKPKELKGTYTVKSNKEQLNNIINKLSDKNLYTIEKDSPPSAEWENGFYYVATKDGSNGQLIEKSDNIKTEDDAINEFINIIIDRKKGSYNDPNTYYIYNENGGLEYDLEANSKEEAFNKFKELVTAPEPKFMYPSHWLEPNVLAFLRINTRTDKDGKKVIFVEETQSDWGQKVREFGFKEDYTNEIVKLNLEKEKINSEILDANKEIDDVARELHDNGLPPYAESYEAMIGKFKTREVIKLEELLAKTRSKSEYDAIKEELKKISDKQIELTGKKYAAYNKRTQLLRDIDNINDKIGNLRYKSSAGYERAPYVSKTNDWTKLALRTLLKEAVRQGADKIAWTTGEQQNKRWSLSSVADKITYSKQSDGTYRIAANKDGENVFTKLDIEEKDLKNYVGVDVANKIINDEGKLYGERSNGEKVKSISGKDLEVGGSGMKSFYGSIKEGKIGILGEMAKALFKQDIKTTDIAIKTPDIWVDATSDNWAVAFHDEKGNEINKKEFETEKEAENYAREISEYITQNSIDITPEMKAEVEMGLPQFQRMSKAESNTELDNIKTELGNKKSMTDDQVQRASQALSDMGMNMISEGKSNINAVGEDIFNEIKKRYPNLDQKQAQDIADTVHGDIIDKEYDIQPVTEVPKSIETESDKAAYEYTSTKNAIVDKEMEAMGLSPIMGAGKREFGQAWDEAMANISRNPKYTDDLLGELEIKPRAVNDIENAAILHRQATLNNDYKKVTDKLQKLRESGASEAEIQKYKLEEARLSDEKLRIYEIGRKVGTETGRGLNARKMLLRDDYTLASMETKKRAVNNGRELTQAEKDEIAKMQAKIEESQKAYDDYIESKQKEVSDVDAQNAIDLITNEIKARGSKAMADVKAKRALIVDSVKAKVASVLDKIAKSQGGGISFQRTPQMEQILKEIRPDIIDLARNLVEDGVTDPNKIIEEIHKELLPSVPNLELRDVRDIISGYGISKTPTTKTQLQEKIAELKTQAKLISRLEDLLAGVSIPKTVAQRAADTQEIADLKRQIKAIEDAMAQAAKPPKPAPPTPLDQLKKRIQKRIDDYNDKIAQLQAGTYQPKQKASAVQYDQQALDLKAQAERAKADFNRYLEEDRLKNRSTEEKLADYFLKIERELKLSGITSILKLSSAALERIAIAPMEEVVGAPISLLLPKKVTSKAYREAGLNLRAEVESLVKTKMNMMKDADSLLKTGKSDLDIMFGKKNAEARNRYLEFFGILHSILKSPAKRAEFERSYVKRAEAMKRAGVDITDPMVDLSIMNDAYKDANRAIFMQDNWAADAFKSFTQRLLRSDAGYAKALGVFTKWMLPFVKVPTNIAGEAIRYSPYGLLDGVTRLGRAYIKGIDNLTPEQADVIVRNLKKGALGTAVVLIGYYNADNIGGYYQRGKKKKKDEVGYGGVRVMGIDIPKVLVHNPLLEMLQLGATIRRVSEQHVKNTAETKGIPEGIIEGYMGIAEEIPLIKTPKQLGQLFDEHTRGKFFYELAKSSIEPVLIQNIAEYLDKDPLTFNSLLFEDPVKRQTEGFAQTMKEGIPFLRSTLPRKGVSLKGTNKSPFGKPSFGKSPFGKSPFGKSPFK